MTRFVFIASNYRFHSGSHTQQLQLNSQLRSLAETLAETLLLYLTSLLILSSVDAAAVAYTKQHGRGRL